MEVLDKLRGSKAALVRDYVGLGRGDNKVPVYVIAGSSPPVIRGEKGGYFTKTGVPIRHSGAYSRKGWSSMVYRRDSREIFVGKDWIA